MITNRTAKLAVKTTRGLLSRNAGISLEAIEGSPLGLLVNATNVPVLPNISLEDLVEGVREASMEDNYGGASEHDLVLEESATGSADALKASIDFARNVLRPTTDQVESRVREALANAQPIRYYVEPYFVHDLFFSSQLKDMVDRHSEAPSEELHRLALEDMDEAALTTMLQTGNGGWDDAVSQWLATKPEGWLHEVYCRVFGPVSGTELIPDYENALKISTMGKLTLELGIQKEDFLLAAYLLASSLYNNPINSDKTGTEWRSLLTTWIQQLGLALNSSIESMARHIKLGRMVLHYPLRDSVWLKNQEDGKIVVFGNVYNQWLGKGGSAEVLIGVLFNGGELPTYANEIDEQRDTYLRSYHRYEQILAREVANRANDLIRQAFITSMLLALGEATTDQLPVGVEREELRARLLEHIDAVTRWESVDIYRTAREMLALYVFCKPTALHLLEAIDEKMDADSELDAAEAAYLVLQEYVAKYVSNQMSVRVTETA